MTSLSFLLVAGILLLVLLQDLSNGKELNNRPVIGVLSQESPENLKLFGPTYIPASYVKFIESAGARVVPILINQTDSYYTKMFKSLNGVLWPGGAVDDLFKSGYGRAGKIFLDLAIQSYDSGDYFPIWGTCQGLQLLSSLTAGDNILGSVKAERESLNVTLQRNYNTSRLLGNAPSDILSALQTKAVTYNFHDFGVTPSNFSKSEKLKTMFNILGTSQTDNGEAFIAIMEGKDYPFYAVQFHPEKPVFEWDLSTKLKHDIWSIKTSQYFANFFVGEARRSLHRFQDDTDEKNLIYNYNPVFMESWSLSFVQVYFFDPNPN